DGFCRCCCVRFAPLFGARRQDAVWHLEQMRLAGSVLAHDHVEAGAEFKVSLSEHSEVLDVQRLEHVGSSIGKSLRNSSSAYPDTLHSAHPLHIFPEFPPPG